MSYCVAANLLYAHSYLDKHVTHSCYFHWDLTLKHTNKNIPEKGVRQDLLKHLIRKRKVRHPGVPKVQILPEPSKALYCIVQRADVQVLDALCCVFCV